MAQNGLPTSKHRCSTDAHADDCLFPKSGSALIAKKILLHAKLVLCDGHRVVDGERKDAKHLSIGDILIEALYNRAHLEMHFYLEGGIKTVNMNACMLPFAMDVGVSLLSKSEADQIWEVAFCSTNYMPLKDASVLDPHVCPVFSRQWMEKEMLTFEQVLNTERVRVNTILMKKKRSGKVKAGETQEPCEARNSMALNALVAQRAHSFMKMHTVFAAKALAVFQTPSLGNSVPFTLHWLKLGAIPEFQFQNDESQNSASGLSIVTLQRESVSQGWHDGCHNDGVQQVFQLYVGPTTSIKNPQSSSQSPMLHLASADLVDRAGVIDDQGGETQWLVDVHADNTSEHVQDLRSSDPPGIDLPGNAPSGPLDLPGAIKSGAVPTEGNGTTLKSITNLSQISPTVPALEQVGLADADAKSQSAPYQIYELPTESLRLVDGYYQQTEKFIQYDGSTFRMDVVAFLSVCHAGLLQKFALPGMPDWMAAMNAVSFMLRTIDVPADELMRSPISNKFASAFALTTLLCVGIQGELEKDLICSFVLEHVDQLKSICYHLQNAEGDAEGTSMAANVLGVFLESFIDVAAGEEEKLFSLEERHNLFFCGFFCIPWERSVKKKVHALVSCMIQVRDVLLSLRGVSDKAYKGELFFMSVLPCLNRVVSTNAHAPFSGNTVHSIAMWLWILLYKLSSGTVAKDIGYASFLVIRNMQCSNVRRFLPHWECLTLLTDVLSSLWPTARKVKETMDQHPVCLWPSTLIALCEWIQLKECLSVANLNYLATHSSPHLIRAVQEECLQIQRQPSCSQYMVQQLIARELACRGNQKRQPQKRRLVDAPIQTMAKDSKVHQRKKQKQHERSE